jgi:hypothetical protein
MITDAPLGDELITTIFLVACFGGEVLRGVDGLRTFFTRGFGVGFRTCGFGGAGVSGLLSTISFSGSALSSVFTESGAGGVSTGICGVGWGTV